MKRGLTRAVTIEAPPARVLSVVADPTTMPRYAAGFARSVTPDGTGGWIADTIRGRLRLVPEVRAEAGTVDFHLTAPDGSESTVFTRVVPSGPGSEFTFTLLLPDAATDAAVAAQATILEQELAALRDLCEREGP
jgi:uncharacterized protein YndB with AHSA1/START domain